jgi:hypothetical protein
MNPLKEKFRAVWESDPDRFGNDFEKIWDILSLVGKVFLSELTDYAHTAKDVYKPILEHEDVSEYISGIVTGHVDIIHRLRCLLDD